MTGRLGKKAQGDATQELHTELLSEPKIPDRAGQELTLLERATELTQGDCVPNIIGKSVGPGGGVSGLSTLAGPAGVFEAAVASRHALPVGQETGYVSPCPR